MTKKTTPSGRPFNAGLLQTGRGVKVRQPPCADVTCECERCVTPPTPAKGSGAPGMVSDSSDRSRFLPPYDSRKDQP
jgi:hypothetical protein